MQEGADGLLHDKTRPPGTPPLPAATVERVVKLAQGEPPGEARHWTGPAMAKAAGISPGSAQAIWKARGSGWCRTGRGPSSSPRTPRSSRSCAVSSAST